MKVGRGNRSGRVRSVGELTRELLRHKRFYQKGKYRGLAKAWAELLGEAAAARTRIRAFRDGELVVEVDSSALLHELDGFMKPRLLAGLQASQAGRDISRIRFCLGEGNNADR